MAETAALAALIVAAVALLIAAAQLSQQLLATAYVIRKCDRIVTGGLTRGGWRQWHWRQFRFTVNYQAIVFSLPPSIYNALGISSTVQVDRGSELNKNIHDRAVKTRLHRNPAQGCWVSLAQDLAASGCLQLGDIGTRNGSADRIPDDLTVAPVRVDCMTVLLSCIAMGMQVFKYSPTTGEVTLGGGTGSISSSIHPILGGILHYSIFANEPMEVSADVKRHGNALRQGSGVWANAVFGRFRDRSYRPQMVSFDILMNRKIPILEQCGWPGDDGSDTIGGAACFMTFAHVDLYEMVPPSVVRPWAAHFAEVIVKVHHLEVLKHRAEGQDGSAHKSRAFVWKAPGHVVEQTILSVHGCSSPHLPDNLITSPYAGNYFTPSGPKELPKATLLLQYGGLMSNLDKYHTSDGERVAENLISDPSSYCDPSVVWDIICLADNYIRRIYESTPLEQRKTLTVWADKIMARAVSNLSNVGAPSWGTASKTIKEWPETFSAACDQVLDVDVSKQPPNEDDGSFHRNLRYCAEFYILRAAYYTLMMRAAPPLGPGLTEGCSIETAMAYMA
ncbi:MAG: hypothetical protein L6R41_006966 [Letrouitia leprolyta]|nr:MAG: hypothetical protein L6R41_006966 [Letrouitia leprolyta]